MTSYGKVGGVALVAACIVFALVVGSATAVAAGSARDESADGTGYVWSMDLDCAC